jgi:hypothetical protein
VQRIKIADIENFEENLVLASRSLSCCENLSSRGGWMYYVHFKDKKAEAQNE